MAELNVDCLVIGAGPGGYVAGIRLGQLGVKTLVVEKDKALGGVCLNWGCIPSKSLIQMAKTYEKTVSGNEKMGIKASGVSIDWGKTQEWKNGIIDSLTSGIAGLLKGNGVEHRFGTATLTSATTADLVEKSGEKHTIRFKNCIIATGSSPIQIPGFTFDHKRIVDSTDLLELKEIPESLILIGGGVIGLELGTVYAKLGTKLTVVEMMDQVLPGTSKDVAQLIERKLKRNKADIYTSAKAKSWKETSQGAELTFEVGGKDQTVTAQMIAVAVGRRPNSKGFGAETIGVKTNDRGFIEVNDKLQTSVPTIYAIGDVVGNPMLAHKASKEGEIAAENIAGHKFSTEDTHVIPGVIFTDPEIGLAGMTEDEAAKKGREVKVGKFPYAALGRAKSTGDIEGFAKIVADAKTERILGVEIVGTNASDMISEAALAIEMGATLDDIHLTVHPHPTLGEIMMEAGKAAKGEAVHILNPKK
ncbi:MAG: dihydrolipoyl dehydrogenase [Bacteroidetes bacterium]|nr:dihydrolipoyl dehydrogenase [Bacteroidota bacterium]